MNNNNRRQAFLPPMNLEHYYSYEYRDTTYYFSYQENYLPYELRGVTYYPVYAARDLNTFFRERTAFAERMIENIGLDFHSASRHEITSRDVHAMSHAAFRGIQYGQPMNPLNNITDYGINPFVDSDRGVMVLKDKTVYDDSFHKAYNDFFD